jgi:hypothetical protein
MLAEYPVAQFNVTAPVPAQLQHYPPVTVTHVTQMLAEYPVAQFNVTAPVPAQLQHYLQAMEIHAEEVNV